MRLFSWVNDCEKIIQEFVILENRKARQPDNRKKNGDMRMKITYHWELDVYKLARQGRKRIFEISKTFPKEERYSLTDQIRRSSRSVCAHIAEAWGRRIYADDFVNRLNRGESETRETQCWLETTVECEYTTRKLVKNCLNFTMRSLGN